MDTKSFIKNKIGELLLLFCVPLLFCYLIPFPYFFITIIISWLGSFVLIYYQAKEAKNFDKLCATKVFLVSFYGQLCQRATFKSAYEISSKYLNTFYPNKSYEEMIEDPGIYNLDKDSFFLYSLDKEKNNEGMLPNYSFLYDEKEKEYNEIMTKKERREKQHKLTLICFALAVFVLALLFIFFSNIKESLESMYYLFAAIIGLSLPLPVIEIDQYLKIKKETKYEK